MKRKLGAVVCENPLCQPRIHSKVTTMNRNVQSATYIALIGVLKLATSDGQPLPAFSRRHSTDKKVVRTNWRFHFVYNLLLSQVCLIPNLLSCLYTPDWRCKDTRIIGWTYPRRVIETNYKILCKTLANVVLLLTLCTSSLILCLIMLPRLGGTAKHWSASRHWNHTSTFDYAYA
jgi:hypothetical protein